MSKRLPIGFGILICSALPGLAAALTGPLPPACVATTLDQYIALGSAGCSMEHEVFADFIFSVLAAGGGATPIAAADVTVTPSRVGEQYSFTFLSAGFQVSGSESVEYLIGYDIDFHPIVTFEDTLEAFSPVFPGSAAVGTAICDGSFFMGAVCPAPATLKTVTVFHMGTTSKLTGSVAIDQALLLGVRNGITLNANGASADFKSFTNTISLVPEPKAWLLTACGLLAQALRRRFYSRPGSSAGSAPRPSLCADVECSSR